MVFCTRAIPIGLHACRNRTARSSDICPPYLIDPSSSGNALSPYASKADSTNGLHFVGSPRVTMLLSTASNGFTAS